MTTRNFLGVLSGVGLLVLMLAIATMSYGLGLTRGINEGLTAFSDGCESYRLMYEAPNSAERFAAREKMKQSVDVCKSSSLHGQGLMASSGLLILIGALLFFPYGIYEVRAWLKKNDEKAAKPQP